MPKKEKNVEEERRALLHWASSISGLPLRDISQVQNGAVFCFIISLICDLDISLVNYSAQEECECLANFRLLQSVAKAEKVRGLNHTAKLAHWGRLAVCENDAWSFLKLLKRCLARAGKDQVCLDIAADSTPPPAPAFRWHGKRRAQTQHCFVHGELEQLEDTSSLGSERRQDGRREGGWEGGMTHQPALESQEGRRFSSQGSSVMSCVSEEELQALIHEAFWLSRENSMELPPLQVA